MENKRVLITGASSGIGLELAKLFAEDHYKMVIVSRDEQQLNRVAEVLIKKGASEVTVIAKDLSLPDSALELHHETIQRELDIDVLVNDAGVGQYGLFSETDLEKEVAIIQLNIISMVQLTKLYLREMLAGNGGRILQLSSVTAYQPTPKLAVYAATKAFILSFSDAIAEELKDTNVTITSLIPKQTATDFFNKAGMQDTKVANDNPDDPALIAKIGYEALMKGEKHATAPGVKQQIVMSSVMPNEQVAEKAGKQMKKVKRENNRH
ncbi:MAG TPA: SDR family oxidoreductase [Bacteroidia bacterium]